MNESRITPEDLQKELNRRDFLLWVAKLAGVLGVVDLGRRFGADLRSKSANSPPFQTTSGEDVSVIKAKPEVEAKAFEPAKMDPKKEPVKPTELKWETMSKQQKVDYAKTIGMPGFYPDSIKYWSFKMKKWKDDFAKKQIDFPLEWQAALMLNESWGKPDHFSGDDYGLFQINETNWAKNEVGDIRFDPDTNALHAAKLLQQARSAYALEKAAGIAKTNEDQNYMIALMYTAGVRGSRNLEQFYDQKTITQKKDYSQRVSDLIKSGWGTDKKLSPDTAAGSFYFSDGVKKSLKELFDSKLQ